jgi:hypothetical protein
LLKDEPFFDPLRGGRRFGQQAAEFFDCPDVITDSRFHSWRDAQRGMYTAEIVVEKEKGNYVPMVQPFSRRHLLGE